MIFLTVGTQLPFDRLVSPVLEWLEKEKEEYVLQVGPTSLDIVDNKAVFNNLEPQKYEEIFEKSELVISHAGMGGILSCLERGKPLIVMPRIHSLGEHRNDHQLATLAGLGDMLEGIAVQDERQLVKLLESRDFKAPHSQDYAALQFSRAIERVIFS